jgi:hypothetical protein
MNLLTFVMYAFYCSSIGTKFTAKNERKIERHKIKLG